MGHSEGAAVPGPLRPEVFQGSSCGSLSGFPSSRPPGNTLLWEVAQTCLAGSLLRPRLSTGGQCSLVHRCTPQRGVTHLFPYTPSGSLTWDSWWALTCRVCPAVVPADGDGRLPPLPQQGCQLVQMQAPG